MKKSFGFVKKVLGFGKKNLYIGIAFLVVVGLLSLFIFSGAREGFDDDDITGEVGVLSPDQMAKLAGLTRNATASNEKKTSDKADRDAESSSS